MQRFKNILYIMGSEAENNIVFKRALLLAENNQAKLTVVSIADEISTDVKLYKTRLSSQEIQSQIIQENQKDIDNLLATFSVENRPNIESKILIGTAYLEIIREVMRGDFDLVIKAVTESNKMFGANDMHLLRKCPCPIWLHKSNDSNFDNKILAAVDVDDNCTLKELDIRHQLNLDVLSIAGSYALSGTADLYVVHVWSAVGESILRSGFSNTSEEDLAAYVKNVKDDRINKLNLLLKEAETKLGSDAVDYLKPKVELLKGKPETEIPKFTDEINASLVVMGTVGRTGLPGLFMGNTAEEILNQLNCSLLAIKPKGFKSPVKLKN